MVRGSRWTSFEIELIKKFYPKYEKAKLLQLLPNRTWRAISDEAQRLGIKVYTRTLAKSFRYYSNNPKLGALGEKFAKLLLEREGFKVYEFKKIDEIKGNNRKIEQAKKFVREVDVKSFVPDFFAFKGDEAFVVEVKVGQSTLYPSQRSILLKSFDYGLKPLIVRIRAHKYFPILLKSDENATTNKP
jgi:hypothetical protein